MQLSNSSSSSSSSNDETLNRRVIVVTGASSGVGYAVARRLATIEGAIVAAVGRRRMFRIEALARQITEQSGEERLLPITVDMASPGQAKALAAQVIEKFGRIDGFVHAVNRVLTLTALEVGDQEFDMTMQVNVKSALQGVQALAPTLRAQRSGSIVIYNPTPVTTATFAASEAVYAAAAQALSALASGWRRQLEPHGIRVTEVAPMPLAESSPTSELCSHDDLILDSLRGSIGDSRDALPGLTIAAWEGEDEEPVVLTRLGGLALTQFSKT